VTRSGEENDPVGLDRAREEGSIERPRSAEARSAILIEKWLSMARSASAACQSSPSAVKNWCARRPAATPEARTRPADVLRRRAARRVRRRRGPRRTCLGEARGTAGAHAARVRRETRSPARARPELLVRASSAFGAFVREPGRSGKRWAFALRAIALSKTAGAQQHLISSPRTRGGPAGRGPGAAALAAPRRRPRRSRCRPDHAVRCGKRVPGQVIQAPGLGGPALRARSNVGPVGRRHGPVR
jgi:hypothetical protein